jgi:hypothetical protein
LFCSPIGGCVFSTLSNSKLANHTPQQQHENIETQRKTKTKRKKTNILGSPIDHQNWQQLLVQQCFATIYNYLFFAHRMVDLNVAPKSLAQVSTNNPISKFPFKGPLMENTDRCRGCDNVCSKWFVLLETIVL